MPESKLIAMLRALAEGGVEFIVVGGLAAVLDGAPVNTFDVDMVHARDDENVRRLARLLSGGSGLIGLTTLGTIGSGLGYADLLPHSEVQDIGNGIRVRVLDLETLIALKEKLGAERDRLMLPVLRRTLEEKRKR